MFNFRGSNFLTVACCFQEVESVGHLSIDGFTAMLASCHTIDNVRIRVQDVRTVFGAMCREQAHAHHVRPIEVHHKHHHHHHHHHHHQQPRTPSPKKYAKKKKIQILKHLSFPSMVVAIVRVALLKYGEVAETETDAVQKFMSMNLFQAGQLLLEPFRENYLYTSR